MYQAIWAPTSDFSEVLISRKMLHDHSPYVVLDALNKVILIACYYPFIALIHAYISFCAFPTLVHFIFDTM